MIKWNKHTQIEVIHKMQNEKSHINKDKIDVLMLFKKQCCFKDKNTYSFTEESFKYFIECHTIKKER